MDIIYRYEPSTSNVPDEHANPGAAEEALREGNQRFIEMVSRVQAEVMGGDPGQPIVIQTSPFSLGFPIVTGQAPSQAPFGLILGCSDARAPVELIFDQSNNDLFVVRVAGNVLGTECLGSLQYAAIHFAESLRLVVVLGHTGCGAVGAAVDLYLDPEKYEAIVKTQALRSIVDRLLVAVRVADKAIERHFGPGVASRQGYRAALWEMAVSLNAAITAQDIVREISTSDNLRVVHGVYDLVSQRVRVLPDHKDAFSPAPRSAADLKILSDQLARSLLDRGVIGST